MTNQPSTDKQLPTDNEHAWSDDTMGREHHSASAKPTSPKGFPLSGATGTGWSVFDADVPYPLAVMFDSAIEHNSKTLMGYCERNHVSLAPHGKTTIGAMFGRTWLNSTNRRLRP